MLPNCSVSARFQDQSPEFNPGIQAVNEEIPCDAYISVGGDIFNNAREGLITKTFLRNLWELRRSPQRTFVFGQSIPRSCHGLSFRALAFCFKRLAAVCVRDVESHKRLMAAGVPAILSFDTAFRLTVSTAAQQEARAAFDALGIRPDQAALISLRAFDSMYGHDNSQFQQRLGQLCQALQNRGHQPILLLQAQAYGADNDLAVAESLVQMVPGVKIFNPFSIPHRCANWELVMAALAQAHLTVAIRYHTAVLRLATGRVPFNLYYSNKGRDLSERLQIPGCNLAEFNPAEQVALIEKTADQSFDHEAIRRQVIQDFSQCYQQVIAP
jgi:polysaccharide pyruvyl transferase WcaK-like protein